MESFGEGTPSPSVPVFNVIDASFSALYLSHVFRLAQGSLSAVLFSELFQVDFVNKNETVSAYDAHMDAG